MNGQQNGSASSVEETDEVCVRSCTAAIGPESPNPKRGFETFAVRALPECASLLNKLNWDQPQWMTYIGPWSRKFTKLTQCSSRKNPARSRMGRRTKDLILIERVPRATTKMVAGLKSVDYQTRLAVLDLFPLEYRRFRGNLILIYALFEQGLANRCHTTRKKHEGWNTAGLPEPRPELPKYGGRVRTRDLPVRALTTELSRAHVEYVDSTVPIPAKGTLEIVVHSIFGSWISFDVSVKSASKSHRSLLRLPVFSRYVACGLPATLRHTVLLSADGLHVGFGVTNPGRQQNGVEVLSQHLFVLFICIWKKETVSDNWGQSEMVPIFEKGLVVASDENLEYADDIVLVFENEAKVQRHRKLWSVLRILEVILVLIVVCQMRERDEQEWLAREARAQQEWAEEQRRREETRQKEIETQDIASTESDTTGLPPWHHPPLPSTAPVPPVNSSDRPPQERCSFFRKTGTCRYGFSCSRRHDYPQRIESAVEEDAAAEDGDHSCIVLCIPHMFTHPHLPPPDATSGELEDSGTLSADEESVLCADYVEFYHDVRDELEARWGRVAALRTCRNRTEHLRGTVYVEFALGSGATWDAAEACAGRWFAGRQLTCMVVRLGGGWREAICGLHHRRRCPKGDSKCNFLHVFLNPGETVTDLHQALKLQLVDRHSLAAEDLPIGVEAVPVHLAVTAHQITIADVLPDRIRPTVPVAEALVVPEIPRDVAFIGAGLHRTVPVRVEKNTRNTRNATRAGTNADILDELTEVIASFGMYFAPTKYQVMIAHVQSPNTSLSTQGRTLEVAELFNGPDFSVTDRVTARTCRARVAFANSRHLWRQSDVSLNRKGGAYQATVGAVLLYGCEIRPFEAAKLRCLQGFEHRCPRTIAGNGGLVRNGYGKKSTEVFVIAGTDSRIRRMIHRIEAFAKFPGRFCSCRLPERHAQELGKVPVQRSMLCSVYIHLEGTGIGTPGFQVVRNKGQAAFVKRLTKHQIELSCQCEKRFIQDPWTDFVSPQRAERVDLAQYLTNVCLCEYLCAGSFWSVGTIYQQEVSEVVAKGELLKGACVKLVIFRRTRGVTVDHAEKKIGHAQRDLDPECIAKRDPHSGVVTTLSRSDCESFDCMVSLANDPQMVSLLSPMRLSTNDPVVALIAASEGWMAFFAAGGPRHIDDLRSFQDRRSTQQTQAVYSKVSEKNKSIRNFEDLVLISFYMLKDKSVRPVLSELIETLLTRRPSNPVDYIADCLNVSTEESALDGICQRLAGLQIQSAMFAFECNRAYGKLHELIHFSIVCDQLYRIEHVSHKQILRYIEDVIKSDDQRFPIIITLAPSIDFTKTFYVKPTEDY
ncbi:kynurenine---oxoglutarate transaminase [Clonorchis sinensis]|uniref:Kynurenine---oxoglutarate transaminase n=1 Tax=Clonorchis sinensis TaxID=79923 RepID=G7YHU0_CLOSI|nr:kynurenine---oxoglutarate transaminase [Clonorchis sinensis]